jgi:2-C-methyl-D-erythritol 4-phosphate cytidylyltransferase
MKTDAVIVSAGKGQRFMQGAKKQFHLLGGRPILAHTIDRFESCPMVRSVYLVVAPEDLDYCLKEIVEKYQYVKISQIVPGGRVRQESVKNGIAALSPDTEIVVIHDGVRPFVTIQMIEMSIRAAAQFGSVVTAVPVKDTIKVVDREARVVQTLERASLWQVQTPQTFQADLIREAYHRAAQDHFLGTDDASLVERMGLKVHVAPGSYENIKITTPEDYLIARAFLKMRDFAESEPGKGRDDA